jgi:hypothetical protein
MTSKKPKKSVEAKHEEMHVITSLKRILKSADGEYISLGKIMHELKDEGLIFLLAVISFPIAIPIPTPPGLTTVFGVPLCFLAAQMIYRIDSLWLPKWIAKKKIKVSMFYKFIQKAEPKLNKISKLFKPRYPRFTTLRFERVVGVIAFICGVSIALPIIGGNAIPSAGIFVMSLGLLYRDGLAVLIGVLISILGICVASAVVISCLHWIPWRKICTRALTLLH